ncbi:MAG: glycosyltransferase family 1 protein, partial [Brachybacterium sp.]
MPVADLAGVARHVLDAVQAGIPGWRIILLCPEGALAEQLRELNAPVLTGPVAPADGAVKATRTIRRTLRRLRPDLLHTHLAFADLAG